MNSLINKIIKGIILKRSLRVKKGFGKTIFKEVVYRLRNEIIVFQTSIHVDIS